MSASKVTFTLTDLCQIVQCFRVINQPAFWINWRRNTHFSPYFNCCSM